MKMKFCGAAREVTGSCHMLILNDGTKILLDCGLYQGGEDSGDEGGSPMLHFNDEWQFDPKEIKCLVLSHAHIDHTGRVPKLVANGFTGKIYATNATRDLCTIMLLDSAKIQEGDAEYHNKKHRALGEAADDEPLYTVSDVYKAMGQFCSYNYEQWFYVHPTVRVMFRDAGHILGSASINLEITEGDQKIRLSFTGDIGRPNRPILRDPIQMPEADYIICESTYGDREHESAPNEIDHFLKVVIHTCVEKRGKLIIPAFSVGRTQEIVYMLSQLHYAGKLPQIPIFVDSPLAVNATEIFVNHPECMDEEIHRYMTDSEDPFGFNNLFYIRTSDASRKLNDIGKPCIIIAASGMMNAGRIVHHTANNIEQKRNTFLIVGYCTPHTIGGELRDGAKHITVFGQHKQVLADVEVMDSFSAHGDRVEMLSFLKNQTGSVKKLFLVHGTIDRQEKWRDYLMANGFTDVEIPSLGDEVTLS